MPALSAGVPELAVDCRCALGECVLWCDRRGALLWTDITAGRLWMHRDGATSRWDVPEQLGCFGFCEDGRLLLGLAKGLYLADIDTSTALALSRVADVEREVDRTRVNDGRSDRHGNFVFGTKSDGDDTRPRGSFYQYSFRHGLRRLALPRAAIPNSICFSRDGGTMYFCDSREPEIRCCDYEPESAAVSNVRRFARVADGGSPDGSGIDADGNLWNAQWGASRVVCYSAEGAERASYPVPARNPSCCAFGGESLDRLYVSTAREDMSAAELEATPEAGGIYAIAIAGARGLPESRVLAA